MDVFESVRTLLAVRQYEDKPVPEAVIHKIVEAAHVTGSSMNKQPWHFIVVQKRETLQQLGNLARNGPYTAQAAFAVVVAIDKNSPFGVSDASRAIQDMMLTAWEEGVGSNWVGFNNLEVIKPLLNIPADLDVLAIVPFGYPAKNIGQGKKQRKSLSEVVHSERFGQPYV